VLTYQAEALLMGNGCHLESAMPKMKTENPTPSIDAYLLEEQSCQISS